MAQTKTKRKNARGRCTRRGCNRPHRAKGLCDSCYRSDRQKAARLASKQGRVCAWADCANPIPTSRRSSAKYCSHECKVKAGNVYTERRHEWQFAYFLRTKFGLSLKDYQAILDAQGGCCAICRTDEPKGRGRWHVDHDHASGRVRGLLCNSCNLMLGHVHDDPAILESAAAYLRG